MSRSTGGVFQAPPCSSRLVAYKCDTRAPPANYSDKRSLGFGRAQPYFTRRMAEFFAEHLLDYHPKGADIDVSSSGR